jgi:hyperosmotically inducible protein
MKKRNLKFVKISGLIAAMAAMGTAGAATVSQDVTEARQEAQIWTTYALNSNLSAANLKVEVKGGKATLSGTVEEGVEKELAKQIALGVSGIKEVDNQIVVDPAYAPPARASQDRNFSEIVSDSTITAAVKSKLMWSKQSGGLRTEVATNNGHVSLNGTADSPAAKDLAGRLARNTDGVIAVDNNLMIEHKQKVVDAASQKANEAAMAVSDSWITAKVKSTLLYTRWVDGTDIKVVTAGGLVTLSGQTDNTSERNLAIELAQNVRGVKKVNAKNLKVI